MNEQAEEDGNLNQEEAVIEEAVENEEVVEETVLGEDVQKSMEPQPIEEVEDGWYYTEDYTYYYVDGEMLSDTIYEIDSEYYAFNSWGELVIGYRENVYIPSIDDWGYVRADSDGCLITGWYENEWGEYEYYYYDYYAPNDVILSFDGKDYYFYSDGTLMINSSILYDGILYFADENGVLSVASGAGNDGWQYINGY